MIISYIKFKYIYIFHTYQIYQIVFSILGTLVGLPKIFRMMEFDHLGVESRKKSPRFGGVFGELGPRI